MPRILIVDDERSVLELEKAILEDQGYSCALASDAAEARERLLVEPFDLLVTDLNMPGESGIDLIRFTLREYPDTAAIMVSAINDCVIAEKALELGVYDYIIKPFDRNSVLISVANAMRRRELEIANRAYRRGLENMVAERTTELERNMGKLQATLKAIIHATSLTVELRDPYTAGHQRRVSELVRAISGEMGLPADRVEGICMGGIIHDLGKIAVPTEILSKPGKISATEFRLIKDHPRVGHNILKDIDFPWPIAKMALQHHERMDGSGYPDGLGGKDILLEARILAVADVVEAMASHRPFRPALGIEKALREIQSNRGTSYDPDVVDACLVVFNERAFRLPRYFQETDLT